MSTHRIKWLTLSSHWNFRNVFYWRTLPDFKHESLLVVAYSLFTLGPVSAWRHFQSVFRFVRFHITAAYRVALPEFQSAILVTQVLFMWFGSKICQGFHFTWKSNVWIQHIIRYKTFSLSVLFSLLLLSSTLEICYEYKNDFSITNFKNTFHSNMNAVKNSVLW